MSRTVCNAKHLILIPNGQLIQAIEGREKGTDCIRFGKSEGANVSFSILYNSITYMF